MQLRCRYYYNNKYRSSNRALAAMFVTWSVYGKPDISMTLNGVLAGLGVTAGCAAVSPVGQLYWTYLWCCSCLRY
jgi:ammonia channel protein AmtB